MAFHRPAFQPKHVDFVSDTDLGNSILSGFKEEYVDFIRTTLVNAQNSWAKFALEDGRETAHEKSARFSEVPCLHDPSLDFVLPDSDLWYFYGTFHEIRRYAECGNFLCKDAFRFVACTESPYADGMTAQTIREWYNKISPGSRLSLKDVEAFFAFLPSSSFSNTIHTVLEIHGKHVRRFVAPIPGSCFGGEVVAFGPAFSQPIEPRPAASILTVAKRCGWPLKTCFRCQMNARSQ
ncbi:RolB family protein [Agrobacterium larrymoorei]|uniref:Cytokinin glycosidase domain-containing protein n=1 Tax=Agrobacterium larrymoorei TaxID=160699 RepID=A0A4D7DV77_9HYPH|nr:hypothetical protein CFBP5473_23880 [Agrobacterium larrymoorei]QYA10340.1 hypothetical protein J5285_22545 [Agrobacterium larrymoorei]